MMMNLTDFLPSYRSHYIAFRFGWPWDGRSEYLWNDSLPTNSLLTALAKICSTGLVGDPGQRGFAAHSGILGLGFRL